MRPRLTYANVVSSLCLFLLLAGGAAYAASHLAKNSVGSKQLKKNAVTTAKVKNEAITGAKVKKGTLTGTQINASTLGTVQAAQTAQTATSLAPLEAWHVVGAPGEPQFENSWKESSAPVRQSVAFYKDHEGIVHLRGSAEGGIAGTIFQLPPGFRPPFNKTPQFPVLCGGIGPCSSPGITELTIFGSGISEAADGGVYVPTPPAATVNLDGITFRAES